VSKAIALSKACLKLLNSGSPDEAYGLSRSIVGTPTESGVALFHRMVR
jgi:hypothetical protein